METQNDSGGKVAPFIDIVFDGPPGPECGRFVEVEDPSGASIGVGDWVKREDGYDVLRIPDHRLIPDLVAALGRIAHADIYTGSMAGHLGRAREVARAALAKAGV